MRSAPTVDSESGTTKYTWCGVVWCGAVRCGAVRCGMGWDGVLYTRCAQRPPYSKPDGFPLEEVRNGGGHLGRQQVFTLLFRQVAVLQNPAVLHDELPLLMQLPPVEHAFIEPCEVLKILAGKILRTQGGRSCTACPLCTRTRTVTVRTDPQKTQEPRLTDSQS